MKQTFLYFGIVFCLLLDGCVPKVCPAYVSVFYQKDDPNSLYYVNKASNPDGDYFLPLGDDSTMTVKGSYSYISYFVDDSTAKEEELYASREMEWSGTVKPRGGFYGKLTNKEEKLSSKNYPNYIIGLTKNPYPVVDEDSTIEFIAEDSVYLVSSSDSLENLMFGGGPGYDDSIVAKELPDQNDDDEDLVVSDSMPPMMYDAEVYLQKYGHIVAREDSMRAGFFIVPDSMYLVKRKWYEIWKPKNYMIPKRVLDEKYNSQLAKYESDSLLKVAKEDSLEQIRLQKELEKEEAAAAESQEENPMDSLPDDEQDANTPAKPEEDW
ncbi:hypothetical protein [Flammeovirga sp. SubArs3]|uniref:hypothetical protein n=1 Tax=Flammeovirga sp. SubArs3 TaxID=2995316 RepID=UPI00248D275F|nr:hypothetical protein [Flammeovirga sp. SubArs3]